MTEMTEYTHTHTHTHIHTGSGDMAAGDRRVGLKTGEWKNPGSKGRGVGQWAGLTT